MMKEKYTEMAYELAEIRKRYDYEESQEEDDLLEEMDVVWEKLTDEEQKEMKQDLPKIVKDYLVCKIHLITRDKKEVDTWAIYKNEGRVSSELCPSHEDKSNCEVYGFRLIKSPTFKTMFIKDCICIINEMIEKRISFWCGTLKESEKLTKKFGEVEMSEEM